MLLIVDRNPITRAMLRALFEGRASAVEFSSSLDDARKRLAGGGVAYALFDEATIKGSGDEWAVALAAALTASKEVDSAIMWSASDVAGIAELKEAGAVKIIAKPIAGPALRDAIYPDNETKKVLAATRSLYPTQLESIDANA